MEVEGLTEDKEETPVERDIIEMPKWLWAFICLAAAGAISHTIQLNVNAGRLDVLVESVNRQQDQIDDVEDLLLDRAPVINEVGSLRKNVENIREIVTEVRDDVLILKAQRHHLIP